VKLTLGNNTFFAGVRCACQVVSGGPKGQSVTRLSGFRNLASRASNSERSTPSRTE